MLAFLAVVAAGAFVPGVSAWGALGHQTVALLAQSYLLPKTITAVQGLLNDTSPTYMGKVATWADAYRSQPGGGFSAPFHYINADDPAPPDSCVVHAMDCPEEGCIVSALANYTARVQDNNLPHDARAEALRFIIHFVGDMAQPLHTEAYGLGGNQILVTFNGARTNLHAIWDTHIPNSIFGLAPNANITLENSLGWANTLSAAINVGKYKWDVYRWVRWYNVRSLKSTTKVTAEWADESNKYVCDYVIAKDPVSYNNTEIVGEYTVGAVPIIEEVVTRAGVRLASWLNLIFEGRTGF